MAFNLFDNKQLPEPMPWSIQPLRANYDKIWIKIQVIYFKKLQ